MCTPSTVYFMANLNQINIDMDLCVCLHCVIHMRLVPGTDCSGESNGKIAAPAWDEDDSLQLINTEPILEKI